MYKKNLGIYIHIPFCNVKCPYCNFYSVFPDESTVQNYMDILLKQIKYWGNKLNHTVNTIYIGGGTPSAINTTYIVEIINAIKSSFKHDLDEITIEINPSNYKKIDFELLKHNNINRISIGAQSINSDEIKILGRTHSFDDINQSIYSCRKYNINNISLDLMLGIPDQTPQKLMNSIHFCLENNIPHISTYLLKVEKNTPYFNMKNLLNFLTDDEHADLYNFLCENLQKNNYNHYEISNFCIKNHQSAHNLKYWKSEEYLGIGPSAHSFVNGQRFYYSNSINDFISNPTIINDGLGGGIEEYCMLALRLSDGLNNNDFYKKFNRNIPTNFFDNAKKLIKHGLVTCDENSIKLTNKGFLLSNSIIINIIY